MLPVIALIGRPNVGKSTLFNRLTRSRDALVADYPGLTRDRKYGFGKLGPVPYLVIDTGGVAGGEVGIDEATVEQSRRALAEADAAIIMVDGRGGLTAADEHVAELARKHAKRTWLAVNKAEGLDAAIASGEFHGLGLGEPIAVSAAHGDRIAALMDAVLAEFDTPTDDEADEDDDEELRIAVIGRPNVGKSTLVNRIVRRKAAVVDELAGQITRWSPAVIGIGKDAFYRQLGLTEDAAYEVTQPTMAANASAAEAQEGFAAFLEKRPAVWSDEADR